MNIAEFADLVDYYLSQLASRNEHHQFEKLCTEIARRRIATNLLIATGPVSAGGDGGRDAESFGSSLPEEVATWFSLRATTASVAVACSLEKSYASKVRSDVRRILRSGDRKFGRIVFFSSQAIPAAKNLALREELERTDCTLAIWDRHAIARALCEPDLHWAAQHYLHLPAELVEQLQPMDEDRGLGANGEVYYVPGQALIQALEYALAISSTVKVSKIPSELIREFRLYVALHLALDQLPLTHQHAYELSREHDESAKRLRSQGSSGAEALRAFGLLS